MNGYDAIAAIMRKEGVTWMACFPDHALINAVAKAGIKPVVFRQERGGIMAADGYSRMMASKGSYGVFACQHGPGVENAFGGIAQAWGDAVPLLFLPDGYPIHRHDVDPFFNAVMNYQNITKLAIPITGPERLEGQMRRAFYALKNGRPGPVLVEMPRGGFMLDEIPAPNGYKPAIRAVSAPSATDVKDAVKHLLAAKRPVLWAGQGVLYAAAAAELRELAELTQIPVIATMQGKCAFDERHPLSLGATNKTAPKAVWKWLKESDAICALGASFSRTNYGIDIPDGKFVIHNTNHVEDIGKEYQTDIGLAGDTKLTLQMMIEEVKAAVGPNGRDGEAIRAEIAQVKREWLEEWSPFLNSNDRPINPYRLVNEINKSIDHENTIFTHDAGHPRDEVMPFYTATVPGSYVGWGKTTHLGYGIGLMIGAKMACPDKFCVNFMGDAAFGMSGLDIETSVRYGAPITTILLNNGTMGGYAERMPSAMEEFNAGNMGGDYAMIAEGLGAKGIKVSDPAEIGPALTKAKQINDSEGRSVLLDISTQPETHFSVY